jgi:signal transduction histidine kinase
VTQPIQYLTPEIRIERLIKQLLLITFIVATAYLILFIFFEFSGVSIPLLSIFMIMPVGLWILIRLRKLELVKVVGLLAFNLCIFLVASSESTRTGIYLYFVPASAAAIAFFRYNERWKSLLFVSFSIALLLLVHLFSFEFIPYRIHTEFESVFLFVMHTVAATFMSVYCMLMILSLNSDAEKYLQQNRLIIEAQNEELKKTNEELDRFVYSASHDLRAPLSSISGLVALMEIDTTSSKDEFIHRIKSSVTVMEQLIRDIEHYSRNSRLALKMEQIDVNELVNDILKSLSHFDNALQISIKNEIPKGSVLYSDNYRLRIILNNLIGNAIKYADLSKEHPYVKIALQMESTYHSLSIEDNGMGIDIEHQTKIFDMFYRASTLSRGSGLGLYIVKESADKMKYEINVQSQLGMGSIFTIRIQEATLLNSNN